MQEINVLYYPSLLYFVIILESLKDDFLIKGGIYEIKMV